LKRHKNLVNRLVSERCSTNPHIQSLFDIYSFQEIIILYDYGWKSTLERAKVIFVDRIRGMIISFNSVKVEFYHHPVLIIFLGMAN